MGGINEQTTRVVTRTAPRSRQRRFGRLAGGILITAWAVAMGFVGAWVFESANLDLPGLRGMGGAGDEPVAGAGIDIRAMGAVPDGRTSAYPATMKALDQLEDEVDPQTGEPTGTGEIHFTGGDYLIDDTIELTSHQSVHIAGDARVLVPEGFNKVLFRFSHPVAMRGGGIYGNGQVIEVGKSGGSATEPGDWTFVEFQGEDSGLSSVDIEGLTVWWPGTFTRYIASGDGWVNAVDVSDTRVFYPRVLLETIAIPPNQNLSFNRWEGVRVQTGEFTDYGVENLIGRSWSFYDVVLWDTGLNPRGVSAVISARASGTVIVGGSLTVKDFKDLGTDTLIVDRFAGSRPDRAGTKP